MKTTIKIFSLAIAIIGFSATSFAQVGVGVSATATASSIIIKPISINKTVDMNFGNVAVNANAGTVVLSYEGTRTASGGVTLPATSGTFAAAEFTIAGAENYTYSITLPSTPTTVTSGTDNMTVTAFTSNPDGTGTLTGGTQTLKVGATLNVGVSQPAGTYTSATPFKVSVNYN